VSGKERLQPFLSAFETFAQTEFTQVLSCYQLADPEDASHRDEDAVDAACDEETERHFVSDGEVDGLRFDHFKEPEFSVMIFDWDEGEEEVKRSLVVRRLFKASLHHHQILGDVCRLLVSGTGLLHATPADVEYRLDFAKVGDAIKCVASWDACRECYGTGFIDGYGTKKSPGLKKGSQVCSWEDQDHRDPDSEARQCRSGWDFNGGLLITDCGPPLAVERFTRPSGAWMHQAMFESD